MAQQDLRLNIKGDASGLTNAVAKAEGKLKSFGSKLSSIGGGLTRSLTLPLVAAGGAAAKMAFDFDKSMTQIKSLVGLAGDEVDAMGERAKKMALDTGKSAAEAADALFFITSAGLRGDEAMQTLEASLKAAAVGLGETKTIADLATSAMNAYGTDTLSASDATDILVAAVREGKLEASELAGAMGGVIPIASSMGVEFNEIGAAMAGMSRTGTNAANAATQLNAILIGMQNPAEQSIDNLAILGLTFEDLERSVAQDGLINTLQSLKGQLEANNLRFKDIFPNVRAVKGLLDLTGASMEENVEINKKLASAVGATDKAFKTTAESASFKMTKSLNEMKGSLLEVGSVLLEMFVPIVTKLGNFLRGASDAFKSLDENTQKVILTFGGILAVVGPVLLAIGKISTTLGTLSRALPLLTANWRAFSAALMANPIIAIATAVLALGTAIYSYTQAQKNALAEIDTIEEVDAALAKKRIKFLEESAKLADGYGGQTRENVKTLQQEIIALEAKKRALEALAKPTEESAAEPTTPTETTTTITGTAGADPNALDKIRQLNEEINNALVTSDRKAYEKRKKDSEQYYDALITAAGNDKEKVKALTQAKYQDLAKIETDENTRIADIQNKIAESTLLTEDQKKALEIKKTNQHYEALIRLATENGLETQALIQAQADAIANINDNSRALALEKAKQFNEAVGQIVTSGLQDLATGIGEALGNAIVNGGNLAGELAKTILGVIGNMAVQLGRLAIGIGIGLEAIEAALTNIHPAVAIAAGIALVALGSVFKATAANIGKGGSAGAVTGGTNNAPLIGGIPAFANGGLVFGPTMGLMGEYPGARSNPEVIAPLSKLQSMIGGRAADVNVGGEFVVRGTDLVVVLDRANKSRNRLI